MKAHNLLHARPTRALSLLMGGALLSLAALQAIAQTAGEVEQSRGVGFAQSPGQTPRTLGKGLPLQEGDRITTSEGASAVVKLADGTRMTVRPNSELVLQQFKYQQNGSDNSMVMQLLRGGLRAITGLIAKGSPNAARIQTNTATIGIRGTDFDARLCARDCATEAQRIAVRPKPNAIQASAKVVISRGQELSAVDGSGQRRRLVEGGAVYPGDVVETGQTTQAVLAFRDDSKVTVGSVSRFRVDSFVFDRQQAGEGRFLVSLLKGSVRAITGLIGKANNRNVSFSTSTATIGIRGTEFLARCTGACAGEAATPNDGLTVYMYEGQTELECRRASGTSQPLSAGNGQQMREDCSTAATGEPANDLIPPSSVAIPGSLFDTASLSESEEGLFVFVRDGHIELTNNSGVLHLGVGEAGFSGTNLIRPNDVPLFIEFDRTPLPTSPNFNVSVLLGDSDIRNNQVCR
jgi:hypothetical protein